MKNPNDSPLVAIENYVTKISSEQMFVREPVLYKDTGVKNSPPGHTKMIKSFPAPSTVGNNPQMPPPEYRSTSQSRLFTFELSPQQTQFPLMHGAMESYTPYSMSAKSLIESANYHSDSSARDGNVSPLSRKMELATPNPSPSLKIPLEFSDPYPPDECITPARQLMDTSTPSAHNSLTPVGVCVTTPKSSLLEATALPPGRCLKPIVSNQHTIKPPGKQEVLSADSLLSKCSSPGVSPGEELSNILNKTSEQLREEGLNPFFLTHSLSSSSSSPNPEGSPLQPHNKKERDIPNPPRKISGTITKSAKRLLQFSLQPR